MLGAHVQDGFVETETDAMQELAFNARRAIAFLRKGDAGLKVKEFRCVLEKNPSSIRFLSWNSSPIS
jgi:hypothetical protein